MMEYVIIKYSKILEKLIDGGENSGIAIALDLSPLKSSPLTFSAYPSYPNPSYPQLLISRKWYISEHGNMVVWTGSAWNRFEGKLKNRSYMIVPKPVFELFDDSSNEFDIVGKEFCISSSDRFWDYGTIEKIKSIIFDYYYGTSSEIDKALDWLSRATKL